MGAPGPSLLGTGDGSCTFLRAPIPERSNLTVQVCGEAALYPSQSGSTRAGRETGGLEVVELSPLQNGRARNGGDRVGVDGSPERLATSRMDARSVDGLIEIPGPQKRGCSVP